MIEYINLISYIVTVLTFLSLLGKTLTWVRNKYFSNVSEEEVLRIAKLKKEVRDNLPPLNDAKYRGDVIVRNWKRDTYPKTQKSSRSVRVSNWFKVELKGEYYNGIEVFVDCIVLRRIRDRDGWVQVDHKETEDDYTAWLIARIPFRLIAAIDWQGDNYYNVPHIYCRFNGMDFSPYEEYMYYYQNEFHGHLSPIEDYRPWKKRGLAELWFKIRLTLNI